MYPPRLSQLAVAGATIAAGIAFASPASASVTYDPGTKTGFVDKNDVAKAFGWSDAVLASRASDVVFGQDFWTDDTYSVACGADAFPVVHHRDFGRFELTGTVVRAGRRGHAGYGGGLVGFRIIGAHSGISGTSVPPAVGQPCPARPGQDETPGATIGAVDLVSSATGWALTAGSGDVRRQLLAGEAPAPASTP
jgi:hypothetical protein